MVGITDKKVNFILDADVRSFFDEVSQSWLVRFVEHRIGDPRIIRLIQKWLKAGVLEDGVVTVSEKGTGQGSVISPLLANVYLHYVFDLWAERWRRREATGDMIIVRYADDIVVGFEHEVDARRFWDAMRERFEEFCAVAASGEDPSDRVRSPSGEPAPSRTGSAAGDLQLPGLHPHLRTFPPGKFLSRGNPGVTACGQAARRSRRSATAHAPADPEQGRWLAQVVRGYFAYHAVPTNSASLGAFRTRWSTSGCGASRAVRRMAVDLGSGSSRSLTTGSRNRKSFIHGRSGRFAVRHPRWEPYAGIRLVRICAGGGR